MNNQRQQEEKCECFCHKNRDRQPGEPFFCLHCQKEQPEQEVHDKLMNMALDHAKSAAHPPVLFTLPQSPRPELKCKCNDIEYCSTCIDSPKAPVSWKDRLNKCFRFKRSLDDRHIYYLADDDDDETQYGYLDQFIEVLMMQAEQKAREEERKRCAEIIKYERDTCLEHRQENEYLEWTSTMNHAENKILNC
jgi:hypothetical protein